MSVDLQERKKERVLSLAAGEAMKGGVLGASIVGAATYYMSLTNTKGFAKNTQISTRVSLPIMAGLFLFSLRYELSITSMNRNPEAWGLTDKEITSMAKENRVSYMPIHHRIANAIYDHPFVAILSFGIPCAGYILKEQLKLKHLTVSQRVMHSRVFAQGSILTMALSTMAFREYMDKHGRFPEAY